MATAAADVTVGEIRPATGKLTLVPLIALVVGSMIGGGVFNLPSDMSRGASPGAIIIGWVITGIGMLMLAFVYQGLAVRKPDLNAGPYAYAKAGFGDFVGFNSAWGYWISAFLGNVAYAVAIFSALSHFFPFFGDGNNLPSIIGASICLWLIHALVLKGVKQAAFINVVTTIAKLVPIFLFILLGILAFNYDKFTFNFWGVADAQGQGGLGSVLDQVKSTMLVTLWVFIGIEGASVYSARAARRADVGRATVIGFLGALGIYVLVTLIANGILIQPELAGLKVPSMAGVFESIVGPWGAALINIGLVISVGGAFLSWTLLCAEIPYTCGKDGTFPKWFAGENANGSPVNSLWVTNGLIQFFILLTFFSEERLSVLLLHRLGCDSAALRLLGRLCPEAGARRRGVRPCGPLAQPGHSDRRGGDDLWSVARLRRRAPVPADVRHPVRARHRRVLAGQARAWRAGVQGLRVADRARDRLPRRPRRLSHPDGHDQPALRRRA